MPQRELGFAAMEALGKAVLVTDRHGVILYVNPEFESITGYEADEVLGKTPALLRSDRQSPAFYQQMWQAIAELGAWEGTLWNRRKDGRHHHEHLSIRRMTAPDGGIHYVGIFSDISEQDTPQRALIDTQKRELMAALTAGMAHSFNNYMAAIQGFAQLGRKMTAEPKSDRYFSEILKATERADVLIREILRIAHPDPSLDGTLDLGTTMRQAMHTAKSILPDHIELCAELPEDRPCPIIGNRSDIEQAVMNLVTNARDALVGRPDAQIRVVVRTSASQPCPEPCPHVAACPIRHGQHVTLMVEDNGAGVPEPLRERIFDPFFTTKGRGKGSGLGLASAKQIVGRLGGVIWHADGSRGGSAFQICLPMPNGQPYAYEP